MIKGITILNETTKWTANGGVLFLGIVLGLCTIFLLYVVIEAFQDSEIGCGIAILLLSFIFGLGSFYATNDYIHRTSYKQYQVTIDNSVKMTEFNERYNVIEQEGKIYTIILKDRSN